MTTTSWSQGDVFRTNSVTSTTTPDYFGKVSRHEILPDNAYSHQGEWTGRAYYSVLVETRTSGNKWRKYSQYSGILTAPSVLLPPFNSSAWDNRFLEKVKQASVSVITMMAERKKTASLVSNLAKGVLYTVTHWRNPRKVLAAWLGPQYTLRKWKLKSIERAIARCTGPADAWLEYRFAIRPLLYDIRDALEAFEKGTKKQHTFCIKKSGIFHDSRLTPNIGPNSSLDGTADLDGRYKIAGRFRVSDPSLAALGNLASVSASLWDLVPFSFVVDWAWDISSYLDLSNATLGLTYVSGYKSIKRTYRRSYRPHPRQDTDWRVTPLTSYPALAVSRYFTRDVLTSCPTPSIRAGTVAKIFGDGHVYDMLALARQRYLSKRTGA